MPVNLINEIDLNQYLTNAVYHGAEPVAIKANNLSDLDFVSAHKEDLALSMVSQWTKHRMRSYLVQSEKAEFLFPIKKNRKLPDWAKTVLKSGGKIYRFDPQHLPVSLKQDIQEIRDFLYDKANEYLEKEIKKSSSAQGKIRIRLDYLKTSNEFTDFNHTLSEANAWHQSLADKKLQKEQKEELKRNSLSGTHTVIQFDDGMKMVRLTTPEALDYESDEMGNCVGKGGYDKSIENKTCEIYSLRDKNDHSHATLEIRGKDVWQCKGKQNGHISLKYRNDVIQFILDNDYVMNEDLKNLGLFVQDNNVYDIFNLPEYFEVKGNLDLSGMGLTELPDLSDVTVKGSFSCSDNRLTTLHGLPKKIEKSFFCSNNLLTSLNGVPDVIHGSFSCSDNLLKTLEGAPKEVEYNFDCSRNKLTSLKGLSKKIGHSVDCSENKLTSLEGLPKTILGNLNCEKNHLTSLKYVPEKVTENFVCSDNLLTSLEEAPKSIGRNFNCESNRLKSLKGSPKQINGLFNCDNNQLKSLIGGPKIVNDRFSCQHNLLNSLSGAPKETGGDFFASHNKLTSLKGISDKIAFSLFIEHNLLTSLKYLPKEIGIGIFCSDNQLQTLEGAPAFVNGIFDCSHNKLKNLDGAPTNVQGEFNCSENQLISLFGGPKIVNESFICKKNFLITLKGLASHIGKSLDCSDNRLISLEGCPSRLENGSLNCEHNRLKNLEHAPKVIGNKFLCSYNQLTSLKGEPEKIGSLFDCSHNKELFLPMEYVRKKNCLSFHWDMQYDTLEPFLEESQKIYRKIKNFLKFRFISKQNIKESHDRN